MALTWAERRRAYVIGGTILVVLTLLSGLVFAVVYEAPSCSDRKQNQDEAGIDCGGSCAYLCDAQVQQLRTPLVRALSTQSGRTDAVAYIENRNQTAEVKQATYEIEIYGDGGVLLGKKSGTVDIPARATIPVFLPGVVPGVTSAPQAFVTFTDLKWRTARGEIEPVTVGSVQLEEGASPRVRTMVGNPSPRATYDRVFIATLYNAQGIAIAASQTVVPNIPAVGEAEAVFTWSAPFTEPVTRVEVRAQPRLP
jgi:hypothetical protein